MLTWALIKHILKYPNVEGKAKGGIAGAFELVVSLFSDTRYYWNNGPRHWFRWLTSSKYRRRKIEAARSMRLLIQALDGGIYNDPSIPLKVESLEATMQVVTFDDRHVRLRGRLG